MTQEEKELLLKDLSARLPYKVHCRVFKLNGDIKENDDILYGVIGDNVVTLKSDKDECLMYYQIKPYLRPGSTMTMEEQFQLGKLLGAATYNLLKGEYSYLKELLEYSYKTHIDLFGLIPKGLALEAPEDMYNI